jgi:hypothetical protein
MGRLAAAPRIWFFSAPIAARASIMRRLAQNSFPDFPELTMPKYRTRLPQLSDRLFLTDAGMRAPSCPISPHSI